MAWSTGALGWGIAAPTFGVLDTALMSALQLATLEPDDAGATWPSAMWTQAEVVGYINDRVRRFISETGLTTSIQYNNPTAGQPIINLPTDCIDVLRLAMRPGIDVASQTFSSGPLVPTVAENVVLGFVPWSDPNNVLAEDGVFSTAIIGSGTSDELRVTGLPFAIPLNTVIIGWVAEYKLQRVAGGANANGQVRLAFNGNTISNYASGSAGIDASLQYITFGSSSDLNGATTLTPAVVNDATFGFQLKVTAGLGSGGTIRADHARITVYYATIAEVYAPEYTELARGDAWELTHTRPDWENQQASESDIYLEGRSASLQAELTPAPDDVSEVELTYVPLGTAATGAGQALAVPADWTPWIKWGVLADMLGKEGESSDPIRAAYAEKRFTEGIDLARIILAGGPS